MRPLYSTEPRYDETITNIAGRPQIPSIFGFFRRVIDRLSIFTRQVERRRKFVALLDRDDRIIDDIGLTRELIEQAAKLPLSKNAAKIALSWSKSKN